MTPDKLRERRRTLEWKRRTREIARQAEAMSLKQIEERDRKWKRQMDDERGVALALAMCGVPGAFF